MDSWSDKLKLLSVLAAVRELVSRSEDDGWPDGSPKEALEELEGAISYLFSPEDNPLTDYTKIMFAPSGLLQEISMSNGWSEAYIALSEEYDKLQYLLNQ